MVPRKIADVLCAISFTTTVWLYARQLEEGRHSRLGSLLRMVKRASHHVVLASLRDVSSSEDRVPCSNVLAWLCHRHHLQPQLRKALSHLIHRVRFQPDPLRLSCMLDSPQNRPRDRCPTHNHIHQPVSSRQKVVRRQGLRAYFPRSHLRTVQGCQLHVFQEKSMHFHQTRVLVNSSHSL